MSLLFVLLLAIAGYGSLGASIATYSEIQALHWGVLCAVVIIVQVVKDALNEMKLFHVNLKTMQHSSFME